MEDPKNGELLVDVGFGFHPPEDSALVGFWEIEAIHLGFQYGGYTSGVTHGVSTVSAIGGMHAEMAFLQRVRSHVSYRLAYNQVFEVLRGPQLRLKDDFFSMGSAYHLNHSYLKSVKDIKETYQRNRFKALGVRDEYRCRAKSVKRLLPLFKAKVSCRSVSIS